MPQSRIEKDITSIKANVQKALPRRNYLYTKDTQLTELIRVMEEIYTIKIDMKNIKTQIGNLEENVRRDLWHNEKAKDMDNKEDKGKEESKAI